MDNSSIKQAPALIVFMCVNVWWIAPKAVLWLVSVCVFQLLDTYIMTSRELDLNTAACRLLQNIMPGLETAVVFQEKVQLYGLLSALHNEGGF